MIMGISLNGLSSGLGDTYSSLLSSASSGNSVSGNAGLLNSSLLTDYAAIKNGSYGKLVKSYYAKSTEDSSSASSTASADKTTKKDASSASAASAAYKAAEKLSSMDISEENRDEAASTIKSFVDSYNTLIKAASKSDIASVQKQADYLNDAMYNSFKLFGNVGITLNEDRTLSIHEDTLKKADIGTLKTLFHGVNSFADKVSAKSSQIYRAANGGGSVTAKTYTSTGSYTKTNTTDSSIDSTT